jgi:hypothetical protein
MVRPVVAMERLLFLDRKGKGGYRWGRQAAELEINLRKLALLISSTEYYS